ncbi:MAG TPA: glycosyltransferase family 4 protein [Alphaproteobacteria bacterium]|nr:glycosyltransferase family 4 protein [Alphaproteobacteria bacterium]
MAKIAQLCAVDFTLRHFLLPLMEGLRAEGHEVVGICAEGALLEPVRAAGFRVEPVKIERSFNLFRHFGAYRELKALFRREGFDIVHVHTPVAALVGRFAARAAKVPRIVYTAHGFYFHEHMGAVRRSIFVALEWLAGRVTHVLFTQAEEDAETARRLGMIRGKVIETIGNGVDPARFHPPADTAERAATRASIGAAPDAVAVMTVGRLVAEKGYPELFTAMRAVPKAELWVVGERLASDHAGGIADEITAIEADPDLGPRIRFLGYREDVADLLRAADIFVLASHREGMPRSIIEAMMTGLPVVATNIRGAREEVVAGETGSLVPVNKPDALAAALNRLVSDAELRRMQGDAGRKRALTHFDESYVVRRQIELLGLIKNTAARP